MTVEPASKHHSNGVPREPVDGLPPSGGGGFDPGNLGDIFDALVRNSAERIEVIDLDGRIVRWNSACEELYGWSSHQVVGSQLPHVEPGQRLRVLREIRSIAASGRVTERDSRTIRADGSCVLSRNMAIPFTDASGNAAGVVLVTREVSDDTRFDGQREDFVGALSRQAKDPMTAIIGYTQLLQRPEILDDAARRQRTVKALADKTAQLSDLFDELQSVLEFEEGKMKLDIEPVDLSELVSTTVARVARRGTQILVDFDSTLKRVPGDRRRLAQAILCLLDNAVRYSPEGKRVEVSVYATLGEAVIEVDDAGPGIDPLAIERIFDRFFVAPSLQASQTGLGLGLWLARAITDAHGGSVSAKNRPGAGSTFTVRLPRFTSEKGSS